MAEGPQPRGEIEALLADHGHRPNKAYGQNFLADPNIVRKIVDIADVSGRSVVEIGAGTGTLTRALASVARRVLAYEVDLSLVPVLTEALADVRNVDVRFADVMEVDLTADLGSDRWAMVANLPYNVGTGVLLDTLRHVPAVDRFVVMVQREVAERLVAEPGSRTYGIPSVVVGLHGRAEVAMRVPAQVFEPRPRVESAVVVIDRIAPPPRAERALSIATAAFGHRRKMLRRSLADVLADPAATLEAAGIDPTSRPERLTASDFVTIAEAEVAS